MSTPRVDDPMILVVAILMAFCVIIIIKIFLNQSTYNSSSRNNSTSYSCFCEYDFVDAYYYRVFRSKYESTLMRRERIELERERERERSLLETRVYNTTFCVVVVLCCFFSDLSLGFSSASKNYFSKVCVSSCVCFFFSQILI